MKRAIEITTRSHGVWRVEFTRHWAWMWCREYGKTHRGFETFYRAGPLYIIRWQKESL